MKIIICSFSKVIVFIFLLTSITTTLKAQTPPDHPRLLFTADDVQGISARVENAVNVYSNTMLLHVQGIANDIEAELTDTTYHPTNLQYSMGVTPAFFFAIVQNATTNHRDNAIDFAERFLLHPSAYSNNADTYEWDYVHGSQSLALIYDLLYTDLTQEQRDSFACSLFRSLQILKADEAVEGHPGTFLGSPTVGYSYSNNHGMMSFYAIGIIALALEGETFPDPSDPQTQMTYDGNDAAVDIQLAYDGLTRHLEVLCGDGAYYEGETYGDYSLGGTLLFAEALDICHPDPNRSIYEFRPSYDDSYRILERIPEWMKGDISITRRAIDPVYMDMGLQVKTYRNERASGRDMPFFLGPIASYYSSDDAWWVYRNRTSFDNIDIWGGNRNSCYLLALVKYDETYTHNTHTPSAPFSFYSKSRGNYYHKNGWAIDSLQWVYEWKEGINPLLEPEVFSWKHDLKNRGIFLASYGGTDFISTRSFDNVPNAQLNNSTLLVRDINNYLGQGTTHLLGQAFAGYLSSDANKIGLATTTSNTVINTDLTPAYNTLYRELNDGQGGYVLKDISNATSGQHTVPLTAFNTIDHYKKIFSYHAGLGSIPPYFISFDRIQKDTRQWDYTLQLYSDSRSTFPLATNLQLLNNTYSITRNNYAMSINNLSLNSLTLNLGAVVTDTPHLTQHRGIQITDPQKVEGWIPLMFTLRNTTYHQTPTFTKEEVHNGDVNYLLGRIQWQASDDIYFLSNSTGLVTSLVESRFPILLHGFRANTKYAWVRTSSLNNSIQSYALSEGKSISYSPPNLPWNINQSYILLGSFESPNTTASWNGSMLNMEFVNNDGLLPTVQEFLFYAPNATSVVANGEAIPFNQYGDYVCRQDPPWALSAPLYGRQGTWSIVRDVNGDNQSDLIIYTEWGRLYIDYGPVFGRWNDEFQYPTEAPIGADFKFSMGVFDNNGVNGAPRQGIVVMNNGVLRIDFPFDGMFLGNWEITVPAYPTNGSLVVDDFTGDGFDDLALKPYDQYFFIDYCINGNFNGIWDYVSPIQDPRFIPGIPLPGYACKGDIDNDGIGDISVWTDNVINGFYVDLSGDGFGQWNGALILFDNWMINQPRPIIAEQIAFADYDGNGSDDIGYIAMQGPAMPGAWQIYFPPAVPLFRQNLFVEWFVYPHWNPAAFPPPYQSDIPLPGHYNGGPLTPGGKFNSVNAGAFRVGNVTPIPPVREPITPKSSPQWVTFENVKAEHSLMVEVYPNPSKTIAKFLIANSKKQSGKLEVRNLLGTLVFSETFNIESDKISIDWKVDNESEGMYMYSISLDDGSTKYGIVSVVK